MYVKLTQSCCDGPFPTELFDEVGNRIREVGHEYGTTTGSSTSCRFGFDSVVMRHSRRVSGITNLSLNSIDVLSGLDTVKICVAYDLDGQRIDYYPASLEQLKRCKPSMKNCQVGLKILLEYVLWKIFLRMHATMFVVLANWWVSVFLHSQ